MTSPTAPVPPTAASFTNRTCGAGVISTTVGSLVGLASVVPLSLGDSVTSGLAMTTALLSVPASEMSVTGVAELPLGKLGGVPVTVAVFSIPPALTSAWVMV